MKTMHMFDLFFFDSHFNDKKMNKTTYLIFYTITVTHIYMYVCMPVNISMHVYLWTTGKKTTMTRLNNSKRWLNMLLLSFHRVVIVNTYLKSLVSDWNRDVVCLFLFLFLFVFIWLIQSSMSARSRIYIYMK